MIDNDAFRCLRVGDNDGFHRGLQVAGSLDFSRTNLRGVDCRKVDLSRVVLTGAYLREADLRGQDLSNHDLAGCSLHNAKVGGVLFPDAFSADEICMSLQHGTRLRPGK